MKNQEEEVINDLVYYKDLKIVQNKNYFNFSLDSVLLPNFVEITPNTKMIMDLCTGNAPIPIILSQKIKGRIIGVEIQKEIYELAVKSIKLNNIKNVEIINEDAKSIVNKYKTDSFNLITCNPPYFKNIESSIKNSNEIKTIARHEVYITLDDIFKIAKKLLKNNGSICIVHRTDRLIEILDTMKKYNIEPKRIQFVYPKINKESNLILIDGRKNGKSGLKLLKPLIIHNDDGSYTKEVIHIFGGNINDTKKL